MERLTYRGTELPYTNGDGERVEAYSDHRVREIINRLAAYEDTGLEPEEIVVQDRTIGAFAKATEGVALSRVRELAQAEREGRVVVLPCKPSGVTIYQLTGKRHARGVGISPRHVSCTSVYANGDYVLCHQGMTYCTNLEFGKSWFLTREEAEKALEAMNNADR